MSTTMAATMAPPTDSRVRFVPLCEIIPADAAPSRRIQTRTFYIHLPFLHRSDNQSSKLKIRFPSFTRKPQTAFREHEHAPARSCLVHKISVLSSDDDLPIPTGKNTITVSTHDLASSDESQPDSPIDITSTPKRSVRPQSTGSPPPASLAVPSRSVRRISAPMQTPVVSTLHTMKPNAETVPLRDCCENCLVSLQTAFDRGYKEKWSLGAMRKRMADQEEEEDPKGESALDNVRSPTDERPYGLANLVLDFQADEAPAQPGANEVEEPAPETEKDASRSPRINNDDNYFMTSNNDKDAAISDKARRRRATMPKIVIHADVDDDELFPLPSPCLTPRESPRVSPQASFDHTSPTRGSNSSTHSSSGSGPPSPMVCPDSVSVLHRPPARRRTTPQGSPVSKSSPAPSPPAKGRVPSPQQQALEMMAQMQREEEQLEMRQEEERMQKQKEAAEVAELQRQEIEVERMRQEQERILQQIEMQRQQQSHGASVSPAKSGGGGSAAKGRLPLPKLSTSTVPTKFGPTGLYKAPEAASSTSSFHALKKRLSFQHKRAQSAESEKPGLFSKRATVSGHLGSGGGLVPPVPVTPTLATIPSAGSPVSDPVSPVTSPGGAQGGWGKSKKKQRATYMHPPIPTSDPPPVPSISSGLANPTPPKRATLHFPLNHGTSVSPDKMPSPIAMSPSQANGYGYGHEYGVHLPSSSTTFKSWATGGGAALVKGLRVGGGFMVPT
ncbi:hypothetical protein BOTBODRAFT_143934 [Botryobasidium botryosum FD-172 SS1]|uniref:Uncharacterized protein n=1 Tax=Botryobasidium botryosum (strain FD-172 SS1) TaxID=930990 RepID=A0A067MPP5_BOTB1|nr:hypothetical protein BOTBODRAFT_143934 [Botryobasidium botryosum FD-172 SS1]